MDHGNHLHWEQLASLHGTGADRYYDLDRVVAGGTLMGAEEASALDVATSGRGLAGLDVLHLQCHLGCDAVTMARLGARVTGVDFSATALRRLGDLAVRCGVDVSTVEADAQRLPHHLDGSFDLVYATIGALCWIEDLDGWMEGVARVLRPGGRLVLVELHPLFTMVDTVDPLVLDFPYGFDGPHEFSGTGSYANPDAEVTWTTTQYGHSIGEVVMAALHAGLAVSHLEEHTSMGFDPRGTDSSGLDQDGRYQLRIGRGRPDDEGRHPPFPLPVLFTLVGAAHAGPDPA